MTACRVKGMDASLKASSTLIPEPL